MKNIVKEYPRSALIGAGLVLPPLAVLTLGQVSAELVSNSNPNDGTQVQADCTRNYFDNLALTFARVEAVFLTAGIIGLVQRRLSDSRQYSYNRTQDSAVSVNLNPGTTSVSLSDDHAMQRGIGQINSY